MVREPTSFACHAAQSTAQNPDADLAAVRCGVVHQGGVVHEHLSTEDESMHEEELGSETGVPNLGNILKRLRLRRGVSLRDVAQATDLSPSFLSAVERGESDISLGRLARVAAYFDHDVGSLLGYTTRRARPQFVRDQDRVMVDRGRGVRYEVLRIPGIGMEVITIDFEPRTGFNDELTHEGVDILLVTRGEVILSVNGVDYPMRAGQCAVWSAAYRHRVRNDSSETASGIAIATESVY